MVMLCIRCHMRPRVRNAARTIPTTQRSALSISISMSLSLSLSLSLVSLGALALGPPVSRTSPSPGLPDSLSSLSSLSSRATWHTRLGVSLRLSVSRHCRDSRRRHGRLRTAPVPLLHRCCTAPAPPPAPGKTRSLALSKPQRRRRGPGARRVDREGIQPREHRTTQRMGGVHTGPHRT